MKHEALRRDNEALCLELLRHLGALPAWKTAASVDEGLRLALSVWGWFAPRHRLEAGDSPVGRLRSLVRRALTMRALVWGLDRDPDTAGRLIRQRAELQAMSCNALSLLVERGLIKPEGMELALCVSANLQNLEEQAIATFLKPPPPLPVKSRKMAVSTQVVP